MQVAILLAVFAGALVIDSQTLLKAAGTRLKIVYFSTMLLTLAVLLLYLFGILPPFPMDRLLRALSLLSLPGP